MFEAQGMAAMNGAGRLAYVVRELPGKVKRTKHRMVEVRKGTDKRPAQYEMKEVVEEEPAGFMVYFPRGHAIRIPNKKLLEHYNLHKKARIINMEGLSDPDSPLGRMMLAQDEAARQGAFIDMERMVIQLATAKSGPQLMPEQMVTKEGA